MECGPDTSERKLIWYAQTGVILVTRNDFDDEVPKKSVD